MLKPIFIEARDLPDLWFQSIVNILDNGNKFIIDRGSYAGQIRLEYDYFFGHVKYPCTKPLIPDIPPHIGIPNPVEEAYIYGGEGYERSYIEYLMTGHKEPGESYCYTEDTEILTDEGWKFFKDLNRKENVATLNPSTEEIEYQKPDDYVGFKFKGSVYELDSKYINFCVNSGHSLFVIPKNSYSKIKNEKFGLKKVEDVFNNKFIKFKKTGIWNGTYVENFILEGQPYNNKRYKDRDGKDLIIPMEKWLLFFGIWLAEGSLRKYENKNSYCVTITISTDLDRAVAKQWCVDAGFNVSEYKKDLFINDKRLYRYLEQFGKAHDKFIPRKYIDLPISQLKFLYDGLMFGYGDSTGYRYTTVSENLANNFTELCFKLGFTAKKVYDTSNGTNSFKTSNGVYRVYISTFYKEPTVLNTIKIVEYSGNLYCVKVPRHHILFVRRNGIAHWSGNTYGERLTKTPLTGDKLNWWNNNHSEIIDKRKVDGKIIFEEDGQLFLNQIEWIIDTYKKFGERNNQMVLQIAHPSDLTLLDPPCLRSIDTRIQEGKLHFFVYFRSWDIYGGMPANLAGIQNLKEYMASEIGVDDGEMIVESKGAHIYGYAEDLVKLRCLK